MPVHMIRTVYCDLMLDVYQPATTVDPLEARPLVIMVHGGGCLVATRSQLSVFLCTELAKEDMAASVNYRLGWQQLGTAMATQPVCPGPGTGHNRTCMQPFAFWRRSQVSTSLIPTIFLWPAAA